jgi:DNA-binding response OmpR family regulator
MKILHIEDNVYKYHEINKVINQCGRHVVDWVECLNDGIKMMEENEYDLVITDMYYPIEKNGEEIEAGDLFIRESSKRGWKVPIILCSSLAYHYPELLGTIHFSFNGDWEDDFKNYMKKLGG